MHLYLKPKEQSMCPMKQTKKDKTRQIKQVTTETCEEIYK